MPSCLQQKTSSGCPTVCYPSQLRTWSRLGDSSNITPQQPDGIRNVLQSLHGFIPDGRTQQGHRVEDVLREIGDIQVPTVSLLMKEVHVQSFFDLTSEAGLAW